METLPDLPLPAGALRRLGHGMLRGSFNGIDHLAVHPRGALVLAAGGGRFGVWDLARGGVRRVRLGGVRCLAFTGTVRATWSSTRAVDPSSTRGTAVDSAMLLLSGEARARAIHEDSDELEALFQSAAAEQQAFAERSWALLGPLGSNALALKTGMDGAYPALLGLDRSGQALVLAVCFD
jgi:hypothetical protein